MVIPTQISEGVCENLCGFVGGPLYFGVCGTCWVVPHSEKTPVFNKYPRTYSLAEKKRIAMLKLKFITRLWKAPRLKQKKKNRCWDCNRKVSNVNKMRFNPPSTFSRGTLHTCMRSFFEIFLLLQIGIAGIECKCGFIFCNSHRSPHDHACTYDHRERQRRILTKQNPKVVAEKIKRIEDC